MAEYKIITDSTTDLSAALIAEMDVHVISMHFAMDGTTYTNDPEGTEISFHDFYEKLRSGGSSTTSQVSMEQFKQAAVPYLEKGIDVLYIAFSSGLSGTYNTCRVCAEDLKEQYPGRKIIVVDSLAASMGEGLLVWHAVQEKKAGKSIEEVAQWTKDNRLKLAHWFTVDDLNHLKRGGRCSGAAAFFGTMMNIKPVLHVDDEGHLIPMEKVRGRKQSLEALVEHMKKTVTNPAEQTVFISHGDCDEDLQYVVKLVRNTFGTKKIYTNYIGPVIGAHSGPGTVALFFLAENRD